MKKLILLSLLLGACASGPKLPEVVNIPTPILPKFSYEKCLKELPTDSLTQDSTWEERLKKHREAELLMQACIKNYESILDSLIR